MKNSDRLIYGLVITVVIFLVSTFIGGKIHLNSNIIADSFVTHSLMLLLSAGAIFAMRANVGYAISLPKFKNVLKPILVGIVIFLVINVIIAIITKLVGSKLEAHPLLNKMSPMQVLFFVFIYASIAEEVLFRGFLQNLLKPFMLGGITIFKRRFSFSVIVSAIAFGLGHLIMIKAGVSPMFLVRIVLFTACLGLAAGYYQEKYNNNAYAIIVHMSGNFIAVVAAFAMSSNT
jgi:membrane protease YdiL (CAAX protease family)